MIKSLNRALALLDRTFLRHVPPRLGLRPRTWVLRRMGAVIGDDVVIGPGVRILEPRGLTLEEGCSVARDCVLDARGGLTIRRHALIGFESVLLSSTHESDLLRVPVHHQGMFHKPVIVGERSWLGARSFVLPGVHVGDEVIVAANSVVTKNVPCRVVVAGSPARRIRSR